MVDIDLEMIRENGLIDLKAIEDRLDQFQNRIHEGPLDVLRDLVDPLVSKANLFNERVEISYSFPVDGKITHVYILPGKMVSDRNPQKNRLPSPMQEINMAALHSRMDIPESKVTMDRATPS